MRGSILVSASCFIRKPSTRSVRSSELIRGSGVMIWGGHLPDKRTRDLVGVRPKA